MKGFILSSEREKIAVISLSTKSTFYSNVKLAIAEHYISEVKTVEFIGNVDNIGLRSSSFDAYNVEDGETCMRKYDLEEVVIY